MSSPIYAHTCVTAAADASTTGGLDAKTENIIHASTIIAPSRSTAQKLFKNVLPTFCVGSPAKVESGIGVIAAYIKILQNQFFTEFCATKAVIERLNILIFGSLV